MSKYANENEVIVAGAGIWGCTLARRLAEAGRKVLVLERRSAVGGNVRCETDPETGSVMLGDMMISVPRCERQGEELGHGYKREIMYLTVHSVLHLLGYDHMDEGKMKAQMRSREKAIMGDD